jgi:hypothetical protein
MVVPVNVAHNPQSERAQTKETPSLGAKNAVR